MRLTKPEFVASICSEEGVANKTDDDLDGTGDYVGSDSIVSMMIDRASAEIGFRLANRYPDVTSYAGSSPPESTASWIQWATAVVAAYYLATRRGQNPPQSLLEQYREVMEGLKDVAVGARSLPGINEHEGVGPRTINFMIDSNFYYRFIRRIHATSTSPRPRGAVVNDANPWSPFGNWF